MSSSDVEGVAEYIVFLRKLQGLRSSSSAHRKARSYHKIADYFGVNDQILRSVFEGILQQALQFIDFFGMSPIN